MGFGAATPTLKNVIIPLTASSGFFIGDSPFPNPTSCQITTKAIRTSKPRSQKANRGHFHWNLKSDKRLSSSMTSSRYDGRSRGLFYSPFTKVKQTLTHYCFGKGKPATELVR